MLITTTTKTTPGHAISLRPLASKLKIVLIRRVEGRSRSVYQVCGWDREGTRLSWEARVEKVRFEVFPERCDRGTVSYLEGERVPKNWVIVTKRI